MKAAIFCGSRTIGSESLPIIHKLMDHFLRDASTDNPCVVIDGAARGADTLFHNAALIAAEAKFEPAIDIGPSIFTERVPAEWDRFGKSAGYRRNETMAIMLDGYRADGYKTFVIALVPGTELTTGTRHMVNIARKKGHPVCVFSAIDGRWLKEL